MESYFSGSTPDGSPTVPNDSASLGVGDEEVRQFPSHDSKKRNRIRFSCTTCRDKKLKCNRQSPCDQCLKRSIVSSCEYVPYEFRRNGDLGSARDSYVSDRAVHNGPTLNELSLQARVRHLEHVVHVLKAEHKSKQTTVAEPPSSSQPGSGEGVDEELVAVDHKRFTETAGPIVQGSRYISSTNWEAILDDITNLTNDLRAFDSDAAVEEPVFTQEGPVLLLGPLPPASFQEMLAHLPPRPVMDRIVSRFFQGKDPAWTMFHIKSLLRHYDKFWTNPYAATFTWLGLMFSIICHTALFCMRADEELPGNLGEPVQIFDAYRALVAQCLALDDYTKPGKYKIETLILYFNIEYRRVNDAVLGTSVLLSAIVRVAMHMGLHRDPRHYPNMSPFEGEMRRRIWNILVGFDVLASFQFGLSSSIHPSLHDTNPPRNLLDDDFDEDTAELPPSRPEETERTMVLYSMVRGRLLSVFGDIVAAISSRTPKTYGDIMRLDKTLQETYGNIPPAFRYKSFDQALVDPVDLIMQRYWLELLYQKSRMVLHRKYIGIARTVPRCLYSRLACLDAATKTLRHQYDIHCEIQPGGRLSKERWFLTSTSTHDFLLADMILCLELSCLFAQENSPAMSDMALRAFGEGKVTTEAVIPKDKLFEILRISKSIWQTQRRQSSEANRAFKFLTKMLFLSTAESHASSPDTAGSLLEGLDPNYNVPFLFESGIMPTPDLSYAAQPHPASTPNQNWDASNNMGGFIPGAHPHQGAFAASAVAPGMPLSPGTEGPSSVDVDTLIDPNVTTNWSLWDNQIQNPTAEMLQIPWTTLFQSASGMGTDQGHG